MRERLGQAYSRTALILPTDRRQRQFDSAKLDRNLRTVPEFGQVPQAQPTFGNVLDGNGVRLAGDPAACRDIAWDTQVA